ncbi:hypothetical protein EVAR_49890_1, partial [Eumeta japonica]
DAAAPRTLPPLGRGLHGLLTNPELCRNPITSMVRHALGQFSALHQLFLSRANVAHRLFRRTHHTRKRVTLSYSERGRVTPAIVYDVPRPPRRQDGTQDDHTKTISE